MSVAGEAVQVDEQRRRKFRPVVVAGAVMALLVLLTPLGLLAPGGAFGEDAPEDLPGKLGLSTVPEGLAHYNGFWHGVIFPGYNVSDTTNPTLGYYVSAIVGILVVGLVIFVVGKLVSSLGGRSQSDKADAEQAEARKS